MLYLDDRRLVQLRDDIASGKIVDGHSLYMHTRNDQLFLLRRYGEALERPFSDRFDSRQELLNVSYVVEQLMLLCSTVNRRIYHRLEIGNMSMRTADDARSFLKTFASYNRELQEAGIQQPLADRVLGAVSTYVWGAIDRSGDNWLNPSPDVSLIRIWTAPALLQAAQL